MTAPIVVQQSFRGRYDDGNETSATWIANLNTNWSKAIGSVARVRFVIAETNARAANNYNYTIWASRNGGAYFQVTNATSFVRFANSEFVTDGIPTTNQLGSGTFVPGTIVESTIVGNVSLNNSFTEMEYMISLFTDVSVGDTIALRVRNGTTALNTYTQTPTITAIAPEAQIYNETMALGRTLGANLLSNEISNNVIALGKELGSAFGSGQVFEETLYDIG